jgi:hypothetical protein
LSATGSKSTAASISDNVLIPKLYSPEAGTTPFRFQTRPPLQAHAGSIPARPTMNLFHPASSTSALIRSPISASVVARS